MAAFTALFTVIAVVGAIATESTFSLLHLAERYVSASCEAQRAALLAAVEPVVASAIAIGMGLAYLVWYPMMVWDFARLARVEHAPT